jgi:hypothetical protein
MMVDNGQSNQPDSETTERDLRAREGARARLDRLAKEYERLKVEQENDPVNHPNHYTQYKGFEVIDVAEQLVGPDGKSGFCLGNAFKYMARAGFKNPDKWVEDLEKVEFYIRREIDRVKGLAKQPGDPVPAPEDTWPRCPSCTLPMDRDSDDKTLYFCTHHTPMLFTNHQRHLCPVCTERMHRYIDAENRYFCPGGHGAVEVDIRGHATFIPVKASFK